MSKTNDVSQSTIRLPEPPAELVEYVARIQRTDIQCNGETERSCTQPWHMDDGVPYCDTCGMYRNTIALQEARCVKSA